jgi:hypothetical protein
MVCQKANGTIWNLQIERNDGAEVNGGPLRLRANRRGSLPRPKTNKALLAGAKAIVAGFQKRGDKLATTTLTRLLGD